MSGVKCSTPLPSATSRLTKSLRWHLQNQSAARFPMAMIPISAFWILRPLIFPRLISRCFPLVAKRPRNWRQRLPKPGVSSLTIPATGAWNRACRSSCPRSMAQHFRATPKRTSLPTRTAQPSRWSWRLNRCRTLRRSNVLWCRPISQYRVLAGLPWTNCSIRPRASM